jgi:membrane fusion protein
VTAYGKAAPLQPGMQLDADVLLERRRLIEWVLDPVFTLTGSWDR